MTSKSAPKNPVKLGNQDFGKNQQKVDFFKRALHLTQFWGLSKLTQKVRVMTRLNPRMRPAIASQISLPKKVTPKWRKPLKSLAQKAGAFEEQEREEQEREEQEREEQERCV